MKKISNLKSLKMLWLWGELPNPNQAFFSKNRISQRVALQELCYIPEVNSAMNARESAVIGDPWLIVSENENEAKIVRDNFDRLGINSIFREIFGALWHGFVVLQHPMIRKGDRYEFQNISALPQEWFLFNEKMELIPNHHDDKSPFNLIAGDSNKEVELAQYRSSFTNPYGESLLAKVFWSSTWICGVMELWLSYLDRFGDDSIIGKIEMPDDYKRTAMLQAIKEFRSSGAMVIEGEDSVDILKTDKSGSTSLFRGFYEVCVQQISRLILGHASAMDSIAGKLGNDQSLSLVRQDITQDDKSFVAEVMNRLIEHFALLNKFTTIPKFVWSAEKEDEVQRINRDQIIASLGFEFSEEYIKKTYRFSEGEVVKKEKSDA